MDAPRIHRGFHCYARLAAHHTSLAIKRLMVQPDVSVLLVTQVGFEMSRKSRVEAQAVDQLDLFASPGQRSSTDVGLSPHKVSASGSSGAQSIPQIPPEYSIPAEPIRAAFGGKAFPTAARPRQREGLIRVLTVDDVPQYSPELIAAAKRSIKEAPTERVLLTYKEINAFFGISRATVARRLKDGVVPGIRMQSGRVLEDGPVRRLDRTQVLYVLLAVRARHS